MKRFVENFEGFLKNTQKINETGEWPRGINWEYVKNNPDADDEFSTQIIELQGMLLQLKEILLSKSVDFTLDILDIIGFDAYQGPYAWVNICGKKFKAWIYGIYRPDPTNYYNDGLFIEGFTITNTDEKDNRQGFKGDLDEIANAIEEYYNS